MATKQKSKPKPKRPLKAIFFDVDDTLYSTSEFAELARVNSVTAMIDLGLRMQKDDALRELSEITEEFTSNYGHHYDKFIIRIPPHYYEGINPALLVATAVTAYHETKFRYLAAYEDVIEVLKLLTRTDLLLGIITSGIQIKQAEKIVWLKVYPYMTPEAIFISDQIGISKPNPKLYQRACNVSSVRPSETMYVGDNPKMDIDPPNSIGMITVLNRRGGKYAEDIPETKPDHEIQNFWDLLEVLQEHYGVEIPHEMG